MISRVRVALRIAAGFGLLIVGGIMALPGVPGPGIVVMLLGLALLSDHFAWARRWLEWAKKKTARLTEKGWWRRSKAGDGEPRTPTESRE